MPCICASVTKIEFLVTKSTCQSNFQLLLELFPAFEITRVISSFCRQTFLSFLIFTLVPILQGNVSHIDPEVARYTPEELRRFRAPGFGPIDRLPAAEFDAHREREHRAALATCPCVSLSPTPRQPSHHPLSLLPPMCCVFGSTPMLSMRRAQEHAPMMRTAFASAIPHDRGMHLTQQNSAVLNVSTRGFGHSAMRRDDSSVQHGRAPVRD
jgi:hypothetical protein